MDPTVSSPPEAQDKSPKLRCPACRFMVSLPATHCSKCGANLSTGYRPEPDEGPARRRGRLVLGGLVLVLVLAVAALLFLTSGPEGGGPARPVADPAPNQSGLGDALETFQGLSDQPIGVRPGKILEQTQDTAGRVEEKWEQIDDIYQDQ